MNHSTMETKRRIKDILSGPVAPYFTDAYNTLISIVQGVALASLFYVVQVSVLPASGPLPALSLTDQIILWGKVALVGVTICAIWVRYITENQYIAWRLGVLDAIVPTGFAVLQSFFALSILESPKIFAIWIAVMFGWGALAYANQRHRMVRPYVKGIYQLHFHPIGSEFGSKLLAKIVEHTKKSFWLMLACCLGATIITALIDWINLRETTANILCLIYGYGTSLFVTFTSVDAKLAKDIQVSGFPFDF